MTSGALFAFSRVGLYGFLLGGIVAGFPRSGAGSETGTSVPVARGVITNQRIYEDPSRGCGPASILNLLKFSREEFRASHEAVPGDTDAAKMRLVVDRFFRNRRSVVHRGQRRWMRTGVESEDLLAAVNELLTESGVTSLRGCYLDRREEESDAEMLSRVHRLFESSLENEVAPILSLRSFFVQEKEGRPAWKVGKHHFVVVVSVSPLQAGLGFSAEVLDSWNGERRRIFVHREPHAQKFRALKGNYDTGRWRGGTPFLQVVAPGMTSVTPEELRWSERLLVTANYLIGDF